MRSLSRRNLIRGTSIIASFSVIAGFPTLFPPALAKDDPPKSEKGPKKTVSPSKPPTKKTNKGPTKKTDKGQGEKK